MTRVLRTMAIAALMLAACGGDETRAGVDAGTDAGIVAACDPAVARGATDCAAVARCKEAGGICASDTSAPFVCIGAILPAIECESHAFASSCCTPSPCYAAGGLCLPQCFGDAGAGAALDAGCGTTGAVCCAGQL